MDSVRKILQRSDEHFRPDVHTTVTCLSDFERDLDSRDI